MNSVYAGSLPVSKSSKANSYAFSPIDPLTGAGVLTIDVHRNAGEYLVTEFPADEGRGFHLEKIDGGSDKEENGYDCFVARNGQDRSCSCKGFQRWGRCKHLDSILALIDNGADLPGHERSEMEAAFSATDAADDRLPNPEDFGLAAGTPDPFA